MRLASLTLACVLVWAGSCAAHAGERASADLGAAQFSLGTDIVYVDLPDTWFSTRNAYTTGGVVSIEDNHSGELTGHALSFGLTGPAIDLLGGPTTITLRGTYLRAQSSRQTECTPDGVSTFCYWPVIVDDPGRGDGNYSWFASESLSQVTDRTLEGWATTLELQQALPTTVPLSVSGGLDLRGQRGTTRFDGTCVDCTPDGVSAHYDETLDTLYSGLYAGLSGEIALGGGLSIATGGTIGLYDAQARYRGHEVQIYPEYPDDLYDLALSARHMAVIAGLSLELKAQFGRLGLSAYGRSEYTSWSPAMAYNNQDIAPVDSWVGTQVGTVIADGDAWVQTVGLRADAKF